jgi:hypothetical protein
MELVLPRCRTGITSLDLEFIMSTLNRHGRRISLVELLADEECRDLILDDEALLKTILESPKNLSISSSLYFYILARHVLRLANIDCRDTADYVGALLTEFSRMERVRTARRGRRPMDYLVDMIMALDGVDEYTKFVIQVHIGNFSLFWSGLFPGHIAHRHHRRAAPKLEYFESIGASHFGIASHHRLAARYDIANTLATLAESFRRTRLALNDLSERLVFVDAPRLAV